MSTPERRYAMTKIGHQDYLVPSNDQRTLWRIARHEEENGHRSWALYRRLMPTSFSLSEIREWGDDWEHWASPLRTRREAIEEAMRNV